MNEVRNQEMNEFEFAKFWVLMDFVVTFFVGDSGGEVVEFALSFFGRGLGGQDRLGVGRGNSAHAW